MAKKNVTVYMVEYTGVNSFKDILLNSHFHEPFQINQYKTSELKFVQENNNGTITGLFVTTQKIGIPPAHKPGEEDDYTAIPLDEGQGLAYPNTILYDIQTNTMYIESNRVGLNENRICDYFIGLAEGVINNFSMSLAAVLKSEAYDRVNNMVLIDSMECRVANPLQLIRNNIERGAIKNFKALASDLNATKTISVMVKAEEVEGGITKREVLKFINIFSHMNVGASFDRKNKLIIKGRKATANTNEGELVEEDVNFFLDKIRGTFILEEPNVASHLQPTDRKRGITSVYEQYHNEVANIVGQNLN
jgi:hypothetical protein